MKNYVVQILLNQEGKEVLSELIAKRLWATLGDWEQNAQIRQILIEILAEVNKAR